MSIKMLKAIAVLLLLLALGWGAGAISATTKSADIQGPSALAVLPDQSVWVSVEDALWHLDANGKRVAVVDANMLGVGGRIGNLIVHPNGQLVAQVRNDPTLYFLDPETGLVKSRLIPQWQSDLSQHGSDAINYAFHDDGRVAIATGGGHAVAVFDAGGYFLGRTKPDLYKFTNGLWWTGDTLWTTDTNRQELVELDGNTLAEKSRVQLSQHCGGFQYLGMAAPSHGKASEDAKSAPLITLVRFANGMTKGRASDIFSDGSQLDYPVAATTEPRDIRWRGNELLMVDGKTFSIKRYSDDRVPMDNFGDAQVQADLTASLDQRNRLENQHKLYLGGAVAFFLIGFGFALRAQSLEKRQTLAALKVDLSQLGTPILSARTRFVTSLKIFWPLILMAISLPFLMPPSGFAGLSQSIFLFIFPTSQILGLVLLRRSIQYNKGNSETEAIFNYTAIRFLQTDSFWRLRQPDELPLETMMLTGTKGGPSWLVLTNQRLLVFVSNLRDRTLAHEYLRSDVLNLRIIGPQEMSRVQKLHRFFSIMSGLVCLEFKDGTSLTGIALPARVAVRMSDILRSTELDTHQISETPQSQQTQAKTRAIDSANNMAMRQTIASILIPGLGQWMQRRSGTALLYFVVWLFVLAPVLIVVWTLWKSLSAVSLRSIITVTSYYFAVCALAALDTWRMRERS